MHLFAMIDKNGLLQQCVEFMECRHSCIRLVFDKVIMNIIEQRDVAQINKCIELGIVQKCYYILTTFCKDELNDRLREERKMICFILSNITTTGTMENILLVEKHGLIEILCDYLSSARYDVAVQALWAFYDITGKKDEGMIDRLVNKYGLIESLCIFLKNDRVESEIMKIGVKCIENMLDCQKDDLSSNGSHVYAEKFAQSGMMKILEEYGNDIIQKYFRNTDD